MKEYTTKTPEETMDIGKEIATSLRGGDIVLLQGDLGAGKTTFVKGVATGLGVEDTVTSPTFSIMNTYKIKFVASDAKHLVHIDTYRLENEQELVDIGIEDYLDDKNTICIIEWPEKIPSLLKNKKTVSIKLSHTENGRTITVA